MKDILGWIFSILIGVTIYYNIVSKRELPETPEGMLEYKKEWKKILIKYVLPFLASLPISFFIYLIINYIFPNLFIEKPFDSTNIISVISSQLNNSLAIIYGTACFLWRYIAVLFKAEDIRKIRLWYTLLDGLGGYQLIILITIIPYLDKILKIK